MPLPIDFKEVEKKEILFFFFFLIWTGSFLEMEDKWQYGKEFSVNEHYKQLRKQNKVKPIKMDALQSLKFHKDSLSTIHFINQFYLLR